MVRPGDFQIFDVLRGNLIVRRKTGAGGIATEKRPVIAFRREGRRCVAARVDYAIMNGAVRVKRRYEGRQQHEENRRGAPVGVAPPRRPHRQRRRQPQGQHQHQRGNHQPRDQAPVAELHFIQRPAKGQQESQNGKRQDIAAADEITDGDEQISETG